MAFSLRLTIGFLKRPAVLVPLVLVAGGLIGWRVYAASRAPGAVTYVSGTVQRSNLEITAKGSGQISSTNQVDLKPKASGTIVAVLVKEGQAVKAGDVVARLDSADAVRAVKDAQTSLETAQLSLQKLRQPADDLSLLQSRNSLEQAKQNLQDAQDGLVKSYDDAFNTVANAFLQLPDVMSGMDAVINGKTSDTGQNFIDAYADAVDSTDPLTLSFKNKAVASYTAARQAYDINFNDYKASSRYQSTELTENLLNETYATVKLVAESAKDTKNFLDFVSDALAKKNRKQPSTLAGHQANLQSYIGTTNVQLGSLLSSVNDISNGKQSIVNDQRSIAEKTASLAKLQQPPDALDVRSAEISIDQRRNALADAQNALADYAVRAPFDGTVTKVVGKVGDTASGAVATLLAPNLIATVSLNEIDVVNVKAGQTANLTFDALPNLKATGTVSEVDTLGTASQGVVNYTVKIALDKADDRIKPGMNVSAAIVTDRRDNVLVVPSSAVRTGRNGSTVQQLGPDGKPVAIDVQTGLTNDTLTEITSGLDEGEKIIVRTVMPTTAAARTGASAIPGLGGAGAGATFRAAGGTGGGNFQFRGTATTGGR